MWTTYRWEFSDENSDMCGEQFFTELKDASLKEHRKYAKECFPGEKLHCLGQVSAFEAEMMGLDTY